MRDILALVRTPRNNLQKIGKKLSISQDIFIPTFPGSASGKQKRKKMTEHERET